MLYPVPRAMGLFSQAGPRRMSGGGVVVPTPTAYWKLNEAATVDPLDASGNGHNLGHGGAIRPGAAADGPFGASRTWTNGGSEYAFSDPPASWWDVSAGGPWTLTTWINLGASAFGEIFKTGNFDNGQLLLWISGGYRIVAYNTSAGGQDSIAITTETIATNGTEFHFIACRYDGAAAGSAKIEISVDAGAWHTTSSAFPATYNSAQDLYIGGNTNKPTAHMARMGWWNGTKLSDAQIVALYNGGSGADPTLP